MVALLLLQRTVVVVVVAVLVSHYTNCHLVNKCIWGPYARVGQLGHSFGIQHKPRIKKKGLSPRRLGLAVCGLRSKHYVRSVVLLLTFVLLLTTSTKLLTVVLYSTTRSCVNAYQHASRSFCPSIVVRVSWSTDSIIYLGMLW